MKTRGAKSSKFQKELDLDDAVHAARGLLLLIVGAIENERGTGLSDLSGDERAEVACLCQNVADDLAGAQLALEIPRLSQKSAAR